MSPEWSILVQQATTDVKLPDTQGQVKRTTCQYCGTPITYKWKMRKFCSPKCNNHAFYAAKKLTAPSFNGVIGVAGVVGTTEGIW